MKRIITILLITISLFGVGCNKKVEGFKDGVEYFTKVDGKYFNYYKKGNWEKDFVKGVNIGAGKPGAFPGELSITKEEYLRWFKQIQEMNGNTIRVYTILSPEFYEAFYTYNKEAKEPLYLMHGVWINEEDISNVMNAHDPLIKEQFKKDTKDLIDIIHGKGNIEKKPGHASGKYEYDISPYVSGFILGIEWDPYFVLDTDGNKSNPTSFDGEYLYTKNSTSFEAFLCEVGNEGIKYETEKYNTQRPVSFSNWVTTDMLKHENEPDFREDMATVNMENIKVKEGFKPGLYASYHVYPYYPESLNYEKAYREYKDDNGKINPYKGYLEDLIKQHTMAVVVAEFGVPSSRGRTHRNSNTEFHQGYLDEKAQGEMNSSMLEDIYETGYAGGIVFAWQDEWFKRTWNTMEYDIADRRAYWSNIQTCEQNFGLVAFDPGVEESVSYIDGEIKEWKRRTPFIKEGEEKVYVNSDEKYLYVMVQGDTGYDFEKNRLVIPVDVTGNSGSKLYDGFEFSRDVDFVIDINGKENSSIKVHSYYDTMYYSYGERLKDKNLEKYKVPNNSIFNTTQLYIRNEVYLPQDNKIIAPQVFETGKLLEGNGNPKSEEYNSLTDFNINGNVVEIRIPWALLNIMDPSRKLAIDDFYKDKIDPMEIENIHIGAFSGDGELKMEMKPYTWGNWDIPMYHERLKESYYIMKDSMEKIGRDLK